MMRNLSFVALVAILGLAGCGPSEEPRRPARPEREERAEEPREERRREEPAETVAAADEGEEDEEDEEGYSYNPIGKRDPFRAFIITDYNQRETGEPLGPLQRYEIDQYRLVGIVWGGEEPRAMVEDPEGVGHVVTVGTLIGKNWGQVTQIKPDELVITEEYRDEIENKLIVNEIPVRLPSFDESDR